MNFKHVWQLALCNALIQLMTTTLFLRLQVQTTEEGLQWLGNMPFMAPAIASTFFVALLRTLEMGKAMAGIVLKWNTKREDFRKSMNRIRVTTYVAVDLILIFLAIVRAVVPFHTRVATTGILYSIGVNILGAFLGLLVYVVLEPCTAFFYAVRNKSEKEAAKEKDE